MLKLFFFLLLAANAALFAVGQGYVGRVADGEREPARLKNQLNAQSLKLVSAAQATAAAEAAAPAPEPEAVEAPAQAALPKPKPVPAAIACLEAGNFMPADARRFEARLQALDLGERLSRRNVPGQEASSWMVNIPPSSSKEATDRKVAELKTHGVTNYFVMPDAEKTRWTISLGVFKQEAAAQTQLAILAKQGVRGARLTPRFSPSKQLAFQFRDIDTAIRARLDRLVAGFDDAQLRRCQ